MIRTWLLWLCGAVLSLAFLSDGATAAENPCPKPPQVQLPAQVAFRIFEPRVVFRHDVDLVGLPRVEGHMEIPPRGWVLQGLTITNEHLEIRTKTARQVLPDGRACIWLFWVEATVGMPEQHVYVANDYPDFSCEYRSVLAHENKHVSINREVIRSFAEPVRKALQDGVTKINPLIFSNANVQDSQITGFLYSLMRPVQETMHAELKRQNGAIDTPEAYIQEHAASGCKNWFPRGVPGYSRR
ncbi:hypothetical protein [Telmatospirillum sp.]|uniref:hypothetical protein n=1 Tax=Telmatospirillum sp. TaxID=2079197 RepID=UPI002844199A|nr:hypothetical protein [Telmatospirillum sp.]MDR3438249.1 hypothetical protein [Telmatospirillum sp.]